MRFVKKDNVYLKMCFDVFRDVSSSGHSAIINPPRAPHLGQIFWNLALMSLQVHLKKLEYREKVHFLL